MQPSGADWHAVEVSARHAARPQTLRTCRHGRHEPVIKDGELAVGRTKQVARVWVRVQEPSVQQLAQVGAQESVAELAYIASCRLCQFLSCTAEAGGGALSCAREIRAAAALQGPSRTLNELHDQNLLGGQVDVWDYDAGELFVDDVLFEPAT